ncbi:hypothetical protein Hoch_4351 [Haliangium ochraceum DSM 14365]|uniref:Uncharacterized protein n=1 Tax=Haliangium ochraceum (strain DSM 14365 / JCM 11303 / SMP-2) TaxID=502025 RepID=D0LMD9_HALO1|nr:hypothetical protein Hoch_4351 [Haliangium ochraceum DSM 14365]
MGFLSGLAFWTSDHWSKVRRVRSRCVAARPGDTLAAVDVDVDGGGDGFADAFVAELLPPPRRDERALVAAAPWPEGQGGAGLSYLSFADLSPGLHRLGVVIRARRGARGAGSALHYSYRIFDLAGESGESLHPRRHG